MVKSIFDIENRLDIQKEFMKMVEVLHNTYDSIYTYEEGYTSFIHYVNREIFKNWPYRDTFLTEIGTLYIYLPTYLEKYSSENNKINIMKLKSLVVSSYIYSELLDWENAKNSAGLAENKYKEMMDDVNYMREYSYNLNKVYVLLEEFKTVIDSEQIELSRVRYINFIEKF